MNRLLLALLPLLMTACASTPTSTPPTVTAAAAQDGVVCEQSSRIGSNMISKHCRSAAQREADKSDAQDLGDKLRRTVGSGAGSEGR